MASVVVEAKKRDKSGTGNARKYRRSGLTPGVLYSHGNDALSLLFDAKMLSYFIGHSHGLIDLSVEGEKEARKCVVKDVQYHPVTEDVIHVDFLAVKMGEKLTISVPLVLKGTAAGIKHGGILEHMLRELEIECMPKDIPDQLEVDVTGMDIGNSIHVADLRYENIEILNDPSETVAIIELAKVAVKEEEEEVEAEEGLEEPELIRDSKKDEDED